MKKIKRAFFLILFFCGLAGAATSDWGEHLPGVTDRVPVAPGQKTLYLTLDACGSPKGKGYDAELIDFLRARGIKATLFMTGMWIKANPEIFAALARDPLFSIQNHGARHRPASVDGKSVYGLQGTASREELRAEVEECALEIERVTGKKPRWYRCGTAYYDSGAIDLITRELGVKIAGFASTLDSGATQPAAEVKRRALAAKPGDILLAHMNHPESETFEGLAPALAILLERGYVFEQLP